MRWRRREDDLEIADVDVRFAPSPPFASLTQPQLYEKTNALTAGSVAGTQPHFVKKDRYAIR
jgi:hypothetical protein